MLSQVNTHTEDVKCWADESVRFREDPHFALVSLRRPTRLVSLAVTRAHTYACNTQRLRLSGESYECVRRHASHIDHRICSVC